jgi:hypothetical protein
LAAVAFEAFYRALGDDTFEASPATTGPWSPDTQHGGPPSALLARAMERYEPVSGQRLARITVEILRPIPLGVMTLRVSTVRPGRRVTLLEASVDVDGTECLRARGWRLAVPDQPTPLIEPPGQPPPPPIPTEDNRNFWPGAYVDGYISAVAWRITAGTMAEPGPADVWTRPRIPLVEGEETSGFCRATVVADSGSGISLAVYPSEHRMINVDLTVVLWREPAGEWTFMSSRTIAGGAGAGLAETMLGDERGYMGRALQTMVSIVR